MNHTIYSILYNLSDLSLKRNYIIIIYSRCIVEKFHLILTMLKVLTVCEKKFRKLLSSAKSGCILSLKFKYLHDLEPLYRMGGKVSFALVLERT